MPLFVRAFFLSLGALLFSLPALAADWETIAPGGETACALGTPYSFHVRKADPEKLVVFFNGGGACWAGQTCDPSVEPTTYVPSADMAHNDPRQHKGIFDLANAANPLRGWSMLFVSYCTGDVHLGASDQTYGKPDGSEITIRHRGRANSQAALDWVRDNFSAPKEILVAGSSAGAIASPVYAGLIADRYPDATVRQLGDGAGGYRSSNLPALLGAWGADAALPAWAYSQETPPTTWNDFYIGAAAAFPRIAFAQYDAAHDAVQVSFQRALKASTDLKSQIEANRAAIAEKVPGFAGYMAGGTEHTILRAPWLYSYSVDGISFRDWLADYVGGGKPVSLSCADIAEGCDAPS